MDDRRIERALRAGPGDEPAYQPLGATLVRGERRVADGGLARGWAAARATGTAVVLLVILLVGPSLIGAPADLWRKVQQSGRLRVGVTAGSPQVTLPGRAPEGFDVDVARAIAQQLELLAVPEPLDRLPADASAVDGGWDLLLHPAPTVELARDLRVGAPISRRSGAVLARESTRIDGLDDLAGRSLCVVGGGLADRWLAGTLAPAVGDQAPVPTGLRVDLAPDLEACLARLRGGDVAALAADWELDVEPVPAGLTRVTVEPFVAWSAPVVDGAAPGGGRLLDTVDAAVARLRGDGTLRNLARRRFGGRDLTDLAGDGA